MRHSSKFFATAITCILLGACETASLAIPPSLEANAVQYPIDGLRGFNFKSDISVANVSGTYRRDSSQTTIAGYESKRAKAHYDIELDGQPVSGDCRMEQGKAVVYADDAFAAIQAVVIANKAYKPMHYACRLTGPAIPDQAEFVLKEVDGNRLHVGAFQETERYGHVRWNNALLGITSTHLMKSESGRYSDTHSMFAPAEGYIIYRGRNPVAAIDLSGKETLHIDPNVSADERDAILIAAISLGLHRDPTQMAGYDEDRVENDNW